MSISDRARYRVTQTLENVADTVMCKVCKTILDGTSPIDGTPIYAQFFGSTHPIKEELTLHPKLNFMKNHLAGSDPIYPFIGHSPIHSAPSQIVSLPLLQHNGPQYLWVDLVCTKKVQTIEGFTGRNHYWSSDSRGVIGFKIDGYSTNRNEYHPNLQPLVEQAHSSILTAYNQEVLDAILRAGHIYTRIHTIPERIRKLLENSIIKSEGALYHLFPALHTLRPNPEIKHVQYAKLGEVEQKEGMTEDWRFRLNEDLNLLATLKGSFANQQ
jgi:hypothetical protein